MDVRGFARESRRAAITTAWLATGSVTQTARRAGVARSTVYALLKSEPELRAERERRHLELTAQAIAWSNAHRGAPLAQGAGELGVSESFVRQALGPRALVHVRRERRSRRYSDAELLAGLRSWHESSGSVTKSEYDQAARVDPALASGGTLVARFGSWSGALEAAGISRRLPAKGGRRRVWTDERLRRVLGEYVAELEAGSASGGLTAWLLAEPGRPSPATVLNRVGCWSDVVAFVRGT